jgi:hypothetical protein
MAKMVIILAALLRRGEKRGDGLETVPAAIHVTGGKAGFVLCEE